MKFIGSVILLFVLVYHCSCSHRENGGTEVQYTKLESSGSGALLKQPVVSDEVVTLGTEHSVLLTTHHHSMRLKLAFLLAGLSSTYSYYLLTKNSIFQDRFSKTPFAQSYLTLILVFLETASCLVSLIYTLIGERLKKYHGTICNWSLLFQTIVCGIISLLLFIPINDTTFGVLIMLLSFISGGLMASITSASMAIAMYLPDYCPQIQFTGRRLADLGSSTLLFASTFFVGSNTNCSDNGTSTGNSTTDTNSGKSISKSQQVSGIAYFASGLIISFVTWIVWGLVFLRSKSYKYAVDRALEAESGTSFALVVEIFKSWKNAVYPIGIVISCMAIEIVAPFFMANVVSSSGKNDFFHTTLFIPTAFMVSSTVSFLATFLPSIKYVHSLTTNSLFVLSLFMLFALVPLFCLLNLESTNPTTCEPMYPAAPRLIKSDPAYFTLIILQLGLFGLIIALFFKKSAGIDEKLKNTMSTLCSLVIHVGLNLGALILFGIIQLFSR